MIDFVKAILSLFLFVMFLNIYPFYLYPIAFVGISMIFLQAFTYIPIWNRKQIRRLKGLYFLMFCLTVFLLIRTEVAHIAIFIAVAYSIVSIIEQEFFEDFLERFQPHIQDAESRFTLSQFLEETLENETHPQ